MQTDQATINQAVEDVKKCDYNDPCSLRKLNGLLYCIPEDMETCQTARFWNKFGVDYQFKLAIDKLKPIAEKFEDTHEYSIDTLLLLTQRINKNEQEETLQHGIKKSYANRRR